MKTTIALAFFWQGDAQPLSSLLNEVHSLLGFLPIVVMTDGRAILLIALMTVDRAMPSL